jgi:hypothetical protein
MDGDPEFLHYFPVPRAQRSNNPNSPIAGFAARIDLKDPCVPITSRLSAAKEAAKAAAEGRRARKQQQ